MNIDQEGIESYVYVKIGIHNLHFLFFENSSDIESNFIKLSDFVETRIEAFFSSNNIFF